MPWPAITLILALALAATILYSRRRFAQLAAQRTEADNRRRLVEREGADKLQDLRSRQEALFDRMLAGVLILDGQGRVQLVNPAVRRQFDLTTDMRGHTLLETIRSHKLQEIVRNTANEGQAVDRELDFVSGLDNRHFSVSAALINETDAESGIIVIFHDLTELKRLEKQRKEFVANVNHELRTPLSLIMGFVETLLDGNVKEPALREEFLRKIQKHSNRLTFLIEDLLVLSQLETAQITLNRGKVPLAELVRRVFDDLQDHADSRAVKLVSQVEENLEIWADADRLQQVIQNLIDNGIKYGKENGEVRVTASRAEPSRLVVQVSDDGPGIPNEARDRIFERFFRVDKARSRDQGGTGLGLAIVKHIVQAHDGRVWLDDSLPGTVFSFSIPADPPRSDAGTRERRPERDYLPGRPG